jgi:LacI family transcriptional regulator
MSTIKDVAALAGVALGTASRVLSGSTQTSSDSRARVLAAAAELNFVPSGPARSLRRAKTDVIGLIVSDIRNTFYSEVAHAAEQEAERQGYTVLLANANEDQDAADSYLRTFASQRIDGLLLSPQGGRTRQLDEFLRSGLPLVLLNRTAPDVDAPTIGSDNADGVAQTLAWLQRHGHRDVVFIAGPETISTSVERSRAWQTLAAQFGVATDDSLIEHGDYQTGGAHAAMTRVLDRGTPFTAVVGANGPSTLGAMRALRDHGASSTPMVSLDDQDWFEFVTPPVSAVRNDAAAIGRDGVRALIRRINGEDVGSVRLPVRFIDRSEANA